MSISNDVNQKVGVTRDGKPILRGNVVQEKLIREVTVKYGDERFDEPFDKSDDQTIFSGVFSSEKVKNLDISRVMQVQVIPDSHFAIPKNYQGIEDENIHVICELHE